MLRMLFILFFYSVAYSQGIVSGQKSVNVPDQSNASLIRVGDLIDVDVIGSFEYDWRGTLNPEGFLEGMERIENPVYALCKSEDEVASAIAKEYGASLRYPKVVVKILDRSNRAVAYLDGAVKFPQRYQIRRRVLLSELLIMSGGITDNSNGEIQIFRPQGLECKSLRVNSAPDSFNVSSDKLAKSISIKISDLLAGLPYANPQISSGDIITVAEASPIYLIGGVNAPQQISLRNETTLSRAISMAGGLSKEGLEDGIRIFRRGASVNRQVIEANLRQILKKEAKDPILMPFDVVEVGQKGRGQSKLPPIVELVLAGSLRSSKLPLRIVD